MGGLRGAAGAYRAATRATGRRRVESAFPSEPSVRKTPVFVVFLTVFIDLLGFGILIPLLPLYGRQYGASMTTVGLLVATYSLMQFIFAPLWGHVSDRIGRKPVLSM